MKKRNEQASKQANVQRGNKKEATYNNNNGREKEKEAKKEAKRKKREKIYISPEQKAKEKFFGVCLYVRTLVYI